MGMVKRNENENERSRKKEKKRKKKSFLFLFWRVKNAMASISEQNELSQ
jgi:hypothetical protein